MLLATRKHNQHSNQLIEVVAGSGLGTATGKMLFPEAAQQMVLAYCNFLNPPFEINHETVTKRPKPISYGV